MGSEPIFTIATLSFSGYVTIVPTLYLGLRWRRFTVLGAIASLLFGNVVLVLCFTEVLPSFGLLPVAWGFAAALFAIRINGPEVITVPGSKWAHLTLATLESHLKITVAVRQDDW